jgi:hypothetical protein
LLFGRELELRNHIAVSIPDEGNLEQSQDVPLPTTAAEPCTTVAVVEVGAQEE